jgi:hypothetical protein
MNHRLNNLFQALNSLLCGSLILSDKQHGCMDAEDNTKPGLMYVILMIVAIGCVIYGIYGWVTGQW